MAHVVFMRAANVGGNNVFRPARLARELASLDVVNIGAAGTFVVRGQMSAAAVHREISARLPFPLAMAVRSADDVLAVVRAEPFARVRFSKERRGWVAVLSAPPARDPVLPVRMPANASWAVRLDAYDRAFAYGLWRLQPGGFVIPANAVERMLGVSATVRWWETFVRIGEIIESG